MYTSLNSEPFQRTNISVHSPLGSHLNHGQTLFLVLINLKAQRVEPLYMREPNPTEPVPIWDRYISRKGSFPEEYLSNK